MADRLSATEVALLALDTQHNPGHVGTVDIFEQDELGYETMMKLISARISFVPRYRMRIRSVPGGIAAPVWVEDDQFDLTYHVRRSGLPRPGTDEQLREFVGRVMARRLDHSRPLWEMYLVDGLEGDRVALITKSHQLLVDGVDNVDIGQVLLDDDPTSEEETLAQREWEPVSEPSELDLVISAVLANAAEPWNIVSNVRRGITVTLGAAIAAGEAVGGVGGAVGELAVNALRGSRAPSDSPLVGTVSEQRRVAMTQFELADLKALRVAHNCTINDVVLALLSGGLRAWLQTRGPVQKPQLLALVPMSVIDDNDEPSSLGSQVAPHLISLPIGEPNPLMRLHQVSFGTKAHKETGRSVAARSIADIAGFAPTTLHALGVRVAGNVVRRQHDLVITNVPGPQRPLYCGGAKMLASYPIQPLDPGHLLSIGVTSYDGRVFVGLTGDRDAVADLDVLAQCVEESLVELTATVADAQRSRQPTRKAPAKKRAPAKKAPASKAAAKKVPAKKTPAKTAPAKKAPANKGTATKSTAAKPTATKAPAKKATPTRSSSNASASARRLAKPSASTRSASGKLPE